MDREMSGMNMEAVEIVREYRTAKSKQKQIGILAELNLCSKAKIVEILRAAGEELPGNYGKKKAAKPAGQKPADAAAKIAEVLQDAAPKMPGQAAEPEYLSIRKLFDLVEGSIAADTREVELTIGGRQVTKVDFRGRYEPGSGTKWKVNLE